MAQRSVYNIINPICVTKNKYIMYKVQDYDSVLRTTTLLNDNVTLSPLLLPTNWNTSGMLVTLSYLTSYM